MITLICREATPLPENGTVADEWTAMLCHGVRPIIAQPTSCPGCIIVSPEDGGGGVFIYSTPEDGVLEIELT